MEPLADLRRGDPVLGRAVRLLRTYRGMSQEELSRKMGASSSSISGWETGRVMPEKASLLSFLATLGLPPEALRQALLFVADLRALERDEARSPFAGLPALQVLQKLGIDPKEGSDKIVEEAPGAQGGEFRSGPARLTAEIDRRSFQIGKAAERSARAFFHTLRVMLADGEGAPPPPPAPED